LMRSGLAKSSMNFTIWLFLLILLLLMLILLYLCYQKCKEKRALSRVGSADANQRLVSGVDTQHPTTSGISPHLGATEFTKTDTAGAKTTTTTTTATVTTTTTAITTNAMTSAANNTGADGGQVIMALDANSGNGTQGATSRQATALTIPGQNPHSARQLNLERIEPTVLTIEPRYDSRQLTEERLSAPSRNKQNVLYGEREGTTSGTRTREETLLKLRRGELFERPRMSVLDHTSAISLDEFWNKNDTSTIVRNERS
uniref:Secreted protein n=1 Tax=Gongylonema pulchrum TaxID=637853 RepID=A0A183EV54_9BILA